MGKGTAVAGFAMNSIEQHDGFAKLHKKLSEHHAALADLHEAVNPLASRLHAKCAACHKSISDLHGERSKAYSEARDAR